MSLINRSIQRQILLQVVLSVQSSMGLTLNNILDHYFNFLASSGINKAIILLLFLDF